MISTEMIRMRFEYDPTTGRFTYKTRPVSDFQPTKLDTADRRCRQWNTRCVGKEAGSIGVNGYRYLSVDGRDVLAHRAAFAIMTKAWPPHSIDHVNGNRADNRWTNLRGVTVAENSRNQKVRVDNKSGCVGVSVHKQTGRWLARIATGKKYKYLGLFDKFEDAVLARKNAERLYGYHKNHGAR